MTHADDNEQAFRERYPVTHDFLEAFYWHKEDGSNLFELLHRVVVRGHPDRMDQLGRELKHIARDQDFTNQTLSELFCRGGNSPYNVVGADSARDTLFCLGEYVQYLRSLLLSVST